jgi:hypothetical protein
LLARLHFAAPVPSNHLIGLSSKNDSVHSSQTDVSI